MRYSDLKDYQEQFQVPVRATSVERSDVDVHDFNCVLDRPIMIIIEFMSNGSLDSYLQVISLYQFHSQCLPFYLIILSET